MTNDPKHVSYVASCTGFQQVNLSVSDLQTYNVYTAKLHHAVTLTYHPVTLKPLHQCPLN